jgi:hypothetical protein
MRRVVLSLLTLGAAFALLMDGGVVGATGAPGSPAPVAAAAAARVPGRLPAVILRGPTGDTTVCKPFGDWYVCRSRTREQAESLGDRRPR